MKTITRLHLLHRTLIRLEIDNRSTSFVSQVKARQWQRQQRGQYRHPTFLSTLYRPCCSSSSSSRHTSVDRANICQPNYLKRQPMDILHSPRAPCRPGSLSNTRINRPKVHTDVRCQATANLCNFRNQLLCPQMRSQCRHWALQTHFRQQRSRHRAWTEMCCCSVWRRWKAI